MDTSLNSPDGITAQFQKFCLEATTVPDVFEFLERHPEASLNSCVAVLMDDLARRVLDDPQFRIEEYLRRLPALGSDPEAVYQLLVRESEIRQACGQALDSREFQQRFPVLWNRLSQLFSEGGAKPGPQRDGTLRASVFGGFVNAPPDANTPQDPIPAPLEANARDAAAHGKDPTPSPAEYETKFPPVPQRPQSAGPDPLKVIGQIYQARYRVTKFIGGGGMGCVYAARDLRFDRADDDASLVAIKFMRRGSESQEGFRREAHLMRQFRHQNFVEVYDYGVTSADLAWLVMEYLPGSTLEQVLARHKGRLPTELVVKFLREVCPALQSAHTRNLVHRDLKPANIMLAYEDTPDETSFKILDFGLSTRMDANDSMANRTMQSAGTPAYMSPEQVKGEAVTPQSDIYSLGIILFQLLTGQLPLPRDNPEMARYNHLFTAPRRFKDVAPDLEFPSEVEEIILQCLEKTAEKRPATVSEVQRRLLEVLAPQTVVAAPPSRVTWWIGGAVIASCIAVPFLLPKPETVREIVNESALQVEFTATPKQVDLAPGRSVEVELGWTGAPDDAEIVLEPVPSQSGAIQVTPTKSGKTSGQDRLTLEARPNPFVSKREDVVVKAIVRRADKDLAAQELHIPVRLIWLQPDLKEPEGTTSEDVKEVGGEFFYPRLERQIGPERVTFLLVPELIGCRLKTFYIMRDKASRSLFTQFLESKASKISPERKKQILEYWKKDGDKPLWPANNLTVEEAHDCARWLGGELPLGEQWDRASGQEFFNKTGACSPPQFWDEEKWKRGPFDDTWSASDKNAIALSGFRDVGTSRLDVSCYGCRDMAGNGTEFVDDVDDGVQRGGRVPFKVTPGKAIGPDILIEFRGRAIPSQNPMLYAQPTFSSAPYAEPNPLASFRVVINP